jgi:3-hydroxyacyl-CoA dehydrogenase
VQIDEYIYLDVRWLEAGWIEAMRLRLEGRVPKEVIDQGLKKGVFELDHAKGEDFVYLTQRGIELTDPGPHSVTEENCSQLAQNFRLQMKRDCWLKAPDVEAVDCNADPLGATYRRKLLTHIHRHERF